MKKFLSFAIVFQLLACSSGGSLVSMSKFYDIPIGATDSDVLSSMGKPYAVKRQEDGSEEYEYIEKIKIGARYAETRRYYLYFKDGKVTSKKVKQDSPSPFIFDSYEMQTTQSHKASDEPEEPQAASKN